MKPPGSSETPPACRLSVLLARDVPEAVIFRRGPSKQVRQIRWSMADDTFQPGQWLSGRLYPERCDLSPDGRLLVYFAGRFRHDPPTFTAVCRPPWFTALALWPDNSTWGGGGHFTSRRTLVLGYGAAPAPLVVPPDGLSVSGCVGKPPRTSPWRDNAWRHPRRSRLVLRRTARRKQADDEPLTVARYQILRGDAVVRDLGRQDWAAWGPSGDLLHSIDGRLFRCPTDAIGAASVCIADFSADRFENIPPPPEARRLPG